MKFSFALLPCYSLYRTCATKPAISGIVLLLFCLSAVTSTTDFEIHILEEIPPGVIVGNLSRYTASFGSYELRQTYYSNYFAYNKKTGSINTTLKIDRDVLLGKCENGSNFGTLLFEQTSKLNQVISAKVIVHDINDNNPEFLSTKVIITIPEESKIGDVFQLTPATDVDCGLNGSVAIYTIAEKTFSGAFELKFSSDRKSLSLVLKKKLDRESKEFYILNVSACDEGVPPRCNFFMLNVNVGDYNDNKPLFHNIPSTVRIHEKCNSGNSITALNVSDADSGDNSVVSLSIKNVFHSGVLKSSELMKLFVIDPIDNELRTKTCLTFDQNNPSYTVVIEAQDQGVPILSSDVTIQVDVVDINDHSPVLHVHLFLPIKENELKMSIGIIYAYDEDDGQNANVTLKIISGNPTNTFYLDRTVPEHSTFSLKLNGTLDYETFRQYNLTIQGWDHGNPPHSVTQNITIPIMDVNDNSPHCQNLSGEILIPENSPVGTFVTVIKAEDNDEGENSRVKFILHDQTKQFQIVESTGVVTTNNVLDYETYKSVQLAITVQDNGTPPLSSPCSVTINITDINDNKPLFTSTTYNIAIPENVSVGSSVLALSATDVDKGNNSQLTFNMLFPSPIIKKTFELNSTTGEILTVRPLDREAIFFYHFIVLASDRGIPPLSSTALVNITVLDINDNKPVFYPDGYYLNLLHNPFGGFIVNMTATDGDSGENGDIYYEIIKSDPGNVHFHIDNKTGIVTTASLLDSAKIYNLEVVAKDGQGMISNISRVHINFITNKTVLPYFEMDFYVFNIDENVRPGTYVGQVNTKIEGVSYVIYNGDPKHIFSITNFGEIRTIGEVDSEEQREYNLQVLAKLGGERILIGLTTVMIFVKDVNDNKPQFQDPSPIITIKDNIPVGSVIYKARAIDPDLGVGGIVKYELPYESDKMFDIDSQTGDLTVEKDLSSLSNLMYFVKIIATDCGLPNLTSIVYVTVDIIKTNIIPPVFQSNCTLIPLARNAPVNYLFLNLTASDPDGGTTSEVHFQLSAIGNEMGYFGIFPNGAMFVRQSLLLSNQSQFLLRVIATDTGYPQLNSISHVKILVLNANNHPDIFKQESYNFEVYENEKVGTLVGKLDLVGNDNVAVTVVNNHADFSFNNVNYEIHTRTVFDREKLNYLTGSCFTLYLQASYKNQPQSGVQLATINIKVKDRNDNKPIFSSSNYIVHIKEDRSPGTTISKLVTIDNDEEENSKVNFSILHTSCFAAFMINKEGSIILNKTLENTNVSHCNLTVQVMNIAFPFFHSTCLLEVIVDDINNNPPKFAKPRISINVEENFPLGQKIIEAIASDKDIGRNSRLAYIISNGNSESIFNLDRKTGEISLLRKLDFESKKTFALIITALDSGVPPLSSSQEIVVNVTDVNDNAPHFVKCESTLNILENITVGTKIGECIANDKDSGHNGVISYSISRENPRGGYFSIDPDVGTLSIKKPLDREKFQSHKLFITAQDRAFPVTSQLRNTMSITIILNDTNDNAPTFTSPPAVAFESSAKVHDHLIILGAHDPDIGVNSKVVFEKGSGGNGTFFRLNKFNGQVSFQPKQPLHNCPYYLNVIASDSGTPRKETFQTVTVFGTGGEKLIFNHQINSTSIFENEPTGKSIIVVSTTPKSDNIKYFITNDSSEGLVMLNATTGVISAKVRLDREARQGEEINLVVYAVDTNCVTHRTGSVAVRITILDINDNVPTFSEDVYEKDVNEDLKNGSKILTLTSRDDDKGRNGSVSYELVGGNNEGVFNITSTTGEIFLSRDLNYESNSLYVLNVTASDDGWPQLSSWCSVVINVLDVNDNPPLFTDTDYSFSVIENSPVGTILGVITANDADSKNNGEVLYRLSGDDSRLFSINSKNGMLRTASVFDREDITVYVIKVVALDLGKPRALSTNTFVYISILDQNDNNPLFSNDQSLTLGVLENVPIGTPISTLTASDKDFGVNSKLAFFISRGNNNNVFAILSDGTIVTASLLDRETTAYYDIQVTVTDLARDYSKRRFSEKSVIVNVLDVNDEIPYFVSADVIHLREDQKVGETFSIVMAVDRDTGLNGQVQYDLQGVLANLFFRIDRYTGALSLKQQLDRENLRSDSINITIEAKDSGKPANLKRRDIKIIIDDVNDNSPVFSPHENQIMVYENFSIGMQLIQLTASDVDQDRNGQVQYAISAGNVGNTFSIHPIDGTVTLVKPLDRETLNKYDLRIKAFDLGTPLMENLTTLYIVVLDVNDNPPLFQESNITRQVKENVQFFPNLCAFIATDKDDGRNGEVIYSIVHEMNTRFLKIENNSGIVSLVSSLDRERKATYSIVIEARDKGEPQLVGLAYLTIIVNDENDNSPIFVHPNLKATILEGSPVGSTLCVMNATDADIDKNGKITYELVKDFSRFKINPETSEITTIADLDRELHGSEFKLIVKAKDEGNPQRETFGNVTGRILDIDDNKATFAKKRYDAFIPRNSPSGTFVTVVVASDKDEGLNGKVIYAIKSQSNLFYIEPETGNILTKSNIPTLTGKWQLDILALNAKTKNQDDRATLVITSKADIFPVFKITDKVFHISEDQKPGLVLLRAEATHDPVFRIASGNEYNQFSLDFTSRNLTLKKQLDYEKKTNYSLWLKASLNTDYSTYFNIKVFVVDVNDNKPVFDMPYYDLFVTENTLQSTTVGTINAEDNDSGQFGLVEYSIVETFAQHWFLIENNTGIIYTKRKIDREKNSSFYFTVLAKDHGSPRKTNKVPVYVKVVDVNDNPPIFDKVDPVYVAENKSPGLLLTKVNAEDKDENSRINYKLEKTGNRDQTFSMRPLTGEIILEKGLDRETIANYQLTVVASDGEHTVKTYLEIIVQDVDDNPPTFQKPLYDVKILEQLPIGSPVIDINVTDHDEAGPNTDAVYYFQRTAVSDKFRIDYKGVITVASNFKYIIAKTASVVDPNQYDLTVFALNPSHQDKEAKTIVHVNVIDGNDHPPVFNQNEYFAYLPNVSKIGANVLMVNATDKYDVGRNSEVQYEIVGGNGTAFFKIKSTTGYITVSRQLTSFVDKVLMLEIQAKDRGKPIQISRIRAKVYITITVENKYPPVFEKDNYDLTLLENYEVGKEFLQVKANDKDSGINGKVTYAILPEKQGKHFTIDLQSGSVAIAKAKLDYEDKTEYSFVIEARDSGQQRKKAFTNVKITVGDYNDNPPVFQSSFYNVNILENSPVGSVVVVIRATDRDTVGSTITYALKGSAKTHFLINKNTGKITTASLLDYESSNVYQLTVLAKDSGDPQKTSDCQVVVSITGMNEFFPKFTERDYTFTTPENSPIGNIIGKVSATDKDKGYDGVIQYELVDPSRNKYFNINQTSGEIFVAGSLDSESISKVHLTILARNPGDIIVNAASTDKVDIIINIKDNNDPPRFLQQFSRYQIFEDTLEGAQVGNLSAVDDDIKPSFKSPFKYSILHGNLNKTFQLTRRDDFAIITTNKRLDREKIAIFNLTIAAIDQTMPKLMGTATLIIEVLDVNDNAPVLKPGICPGHVKENQPGGTVVANLNAADKDIDPNKDPYTFQIVNKEHLPFIIDNLQLKTKIPLDREKIPSYNISIKVEDSGYPKQYSICFCEIIVEDINDNQPSAETLKVIVNVPINGFNDVVIGDVSPVDVDIVNAYSCQVEGTLHKDIFSFQPNSCNLITKKPPLTFYVLNVRARDELSNQVSYSLNISFNMIPDLASQNSVILRLSSITPRRLLTVLDSIRCRSGYDEQIWSIQPFSGVVTDVLLVYLKNGILTSKQKVLEILKQCQSSLEKQIDAKIIDTDYNLCSSSNPCINGDCQSALMLYPANRTTLYSKTSVFVSVYHKVTVSCRCFPGYTGINCEYSTKPCLTKPCKNGGECISTGVNFSCKCLPNYSGTLCDIPVNLCNPNPCSNWSVCISSPEGPSCHCDFGARGKTCEFSSTGFYPLSYMKLPLASSNVKKIYNISLQFATVEDRALILFSHDGKSGDYSRFIAIEIVESRLRFSFSVRGVIIHLVSDTHVADGLWHSVIAIKDKQVGYLSVDGETKSVHTKDDFEYISSVYLGGVPSLHVIFSQTAEINSYDFVGCMRDIYLNGRMVNEKKALVKHGVVPHCPRFPEIKCKNQRCKQGSKCIDKWFKSLCQCENEKCSQNAKLTIGDSTLLFHFDPSFLRENEFREKQIALRSRRRRNAEEVQSFSMRIRPRNFNAFLWRAEDSLGNYTELLLTDSGFLSLKFGKIGHRYHIKIVSDVHIKIDRWFNITVLRDIPSNALTLVVDNSQHKTYPEQPYLFFGGTWTFGNIKNNQSAQAFDGCLSSIRINDEVLSVNTSNQYGILTIVEGKIENGCKAPDFCVPNPCTGTSRCVSEWKTYKCVAAPESSNNTLSVGAIAAIVFFVILVIAIVVAVIAVKKRKTRNLFASGLSKKTDVDGEQDNSRGSSSSESIPSRKTPSRHSLDSGVEIHNTNTSLSSRDIKKTSSANVISLGPPDEYTIVSSRRDSESEQRDTGFTDSECEYGLTNFGANLTISSIPSNVDSNSSVRGKHRPERSALNYSKKVPYLFNRGYLKDTGRPSRSTTPSEEQESIEMQNYSIDIEAAEHYSIGDASLATYSDLNFSNNPARSLDTDHIQRYRPSLERFSESDDPADERQLSNLNDAFDEAGDVSSVSSDGGFTISEYDYGRRPSYEENAQRINNKSLEEENLNAAPTNDNSAFENMNNESSVDEDMSWDDVANWGTKYNDVRNTSVAIAQLSDDEENIEIV